MNIKNTPSRFFRAAMQGENGFWSYVAVIVVVLLGWQLVGAIPLMIGVGIAVPKGEETETALAEFAEGMDFAAVGLDPLVGLVLLIASFGFGILALWWMMRVVHKRPFKTLITPRADIDYRKILVGAGLWFGLMGIYEIIGYIIDPDNYILNFELSRFLPLLLIALFLLPIQTSFEELFFRGYLMQGIGLAAKNRWVPLLLTSVIFGGIHYFNPEVQEYGAGIMMVNYIGIGLMLGIITLMDDGLELALGVHAANNIYGATMVTFSASALKTPALFTIKELDVHLSTIAVLIAAVIFIFLLAKIYGWNDWSRLYRPLDTSSSDIFADENTEIQKL